MEVIQTREDNTVKAGITRSHKMTIDEGASIFYLLSEALYSDPVISSVREIITNAYDAHIVNGVKEPVKVTTSGETGLITVQDSGGGIPHDEFNKVYGSLGYSTKVGSKEQTGGMGIGKLSPLALNDSFFVYNTFNGTTKLHIISRGTNETKGAHTISTSDVNEVGTEDGLKVVFGINSGYSTIYSVNRYIKKLSYIGLIPIELNNDSLYQLTNSIDTDTKGFFVQSVTGIFIKYGNNFYNAPSQWVRDSRLLLEYSLHDSVGLVLCAEPESLQITPSREELLITDSNRNTILSLFRNILNELNKHKKIIHDNTLSYCELTLDYFERFQFVTKHDPNTSLTAPVTTIKDGIDDHIVLTRLRELDVSKVLYSKYPKLGLKRCNDLAAWNKLSGAEEGKANKYKLSRRANKIVKLFNSLSLRSSSIVTVGSRWLTNNTVSSYSFLFLLHPVINSNTRIVVTNSKTYRDGSIVLYTGSRNDPEEFGEKLRKLLPNLTIDIHSVTKNRETVKTNAGVNLYKLLTGKDETKNRFSHYVYEGANPTLLKDLTRLGELPEDFSKGVFSVFKEMDKDFKNYFICEKDVSNRATVKKVVNSSTILNKMRETMVKINKELYIISDTIKDCVKNNKELVLNKDKMTKGKYSIIRVLARNTLPDSKELTQSEVQRVYEFILLMVYLVDRDKHYNRRDTNSMLKVQSIKENIKAISYLSNTRNLDGFVDSLITEVELKNEN